MFSRSGDEWMVVPDIRERVSFAYGDVLSAEFRQFKNYDLVLGQNFMIHMDKASAKTALASLVAAARSGGALFLGRDGSRHQDRDGGFAPAGAGWTGTWRRSTTRTRCAARPGRGPIGR